MVILIRPNLQTVVKTKIKDNLKNKEKNLWLNRLNEFI